MTNFYCKLNDGTEYTDSDLISFNKIAIYGDKSVNEIIITEENNVAKVDYTTGVISMNDEVLYSCEDSVVSLLRPICIRRVTEKYNVVPVEGMSSVGRKVMFGLGYQYTVEGKNFKKILIFDNMNFYLKNN